MINFWQRIEIAELCKGVHCVDLVKSFQTHIYLQKLASVQPRTSPLKFASSSGAAHIEAAVEASNKAKELSTVARLVLFRGFVRYLSRLLEAPWRRFFCTSTQRISTATHLFCFLNNLSGVRMLTTFYLTKNDHRWVILISLKATFADYSAAAIILLKIAAKLFTPKGDDHWHKHMDP